MSSLRGGVILNQQGCFIPLVYPVLQDVGGMKVLSIRDLGVGLDTAQPDGKATLPWRDGDMMVTFRLEGGASITLRASGEVHPN